MIPLHALSHKLAFSRQLPTASTLDCGTLFENPYAYSLHTERPIFLNAFMQPAIGVPGDWLLGGQKGVDMIKVRKQGPADSTDAEIGGAARRKHDAADGKPVF